MSVDHTDLSATAPQRRALLLHIILRLPAQAGIDTPAAREIRQEGMQALTRVLQSHGALVLQHSSDRLTALWDWGDCTAEDVDLTAPAEMSEVLPHLTPGTDLAALPCSAKVRRTLEHRFADPMFQNVVHRALDGLQSASDTLQKLNYQRYGNGQSGWLERLHLTQPVQAQMAMCHGKVFMTQHQPTGLSFKLVSDMAELASPGSVVCGPVLMRAIAELENESHADAPPHTHTAEYLQVRGLGQTTEVRANMWQLKWHH